MKTDRFTDIIRRKLESIRPEFTEKDWTRMQASLQQANLPQPDMSGAGQPFSGGVWSGQPWLLAAAAVSTVVLVSLGVWQRSEINTLRQTVSELSKQRVVKPVIPSTDATSLQQRSTAPNIAQTNKLNQSGMGSATDVSAIKIQRDTVYITRYVAVPSRGRPETVDDMRSGERTNGLPTQRYSANSHNKIQEETARVANNLNSKTESYDVTSTPLSVEKSSGTTSADPAIRPTSGSPGKDLLNGNKSTSGQYVAGGTNGQNNPPTDYRGSQPADSGNSANTNGATSDKSATSATDNVAAQNDVATEANAAKLAGVTEYELVASHDLKMASPNWNALLAQRARRMRPVRTTVVNQTNQAPESQPVQRIGTRFRAGAGGEFDSRLWSAGVFTQVLFGRHLMLGVGLNQATYMNGMFITAEEFDLRTQRNFRMEFGRNLDPRLDLKGDVINIDTRLVRVQIPISISYRIPINQSLTMVSTVGTYLALSNTEKVTYYYRKYIKGSFTEASFNVERPVDLINSVAFSPGLEWQNKHIVVQAAPVITVPTCLYKVPGPNWQSNTTIGLRAGLFYQF
ncbi:hypothetical protein GCM10028807_35170 [Spirosoma daeguense]